MRGLPFFLAVVVAALARSGSLQTPVTGQDIYRVRCAMCHGVEGRGDGTAAAAMNPRPTNLTARAQRTALADSAVAAVVTNGRRAMPAFGRMLTKAQVDSVVAYVRTLAH